MDLKAATRVPVIPVFPRIHNIQNGKELWMSDFSSVLFIDRVPQRPTLARAHP